MGTAYAYFKSSSNKPISRQLLKFFDRNSAKSVPNSWIMSVAMSTNFEGF